MTSAVLKSIAQRAAKFCSADDVQIHVVEGTVLRCVADYGNLPASAGRELIPISPDFVAGKAVRERRTIYLRNLAVRSGRKPSRRAGDGYHSILVAPLMCDGAAIGTISLGRKQLHPFSDEQVELLESFANEAAITIENTRLVNELQERNKALTESLEQQTATSEILHVISQSQQDAQPVFETIAASAQKLCRAQIGTVFTFDGELVHAAALHSISPEGLEAVQRAFPMPPSRAGGTPRAILTRAVAYIRDVREDPDLDHQLKSLAEVAGYRSVLSVPMLRDGSPIGAISVTGVQPAMFTERQIAMLKTFADQAVIAIENTRLFNELQERLEQQTATSDILRVISQSQRDVQPVFETIAANARKLCRGLTGVVYTFDGELIHVAALGDVVRTEASDEMRRAYPMPPSRGAASGRAILSGTVAYIRDVREDPEYRLRTSQAAGTPCVVAVPLLRDGRPIGAITVSGGEPGMFTERQIAMLQTFADQAVIAIENTRLFNELETRNRDLTEALEQQTATSEILRVISSSPTNLQPVLDTIARSAAHFCNASDVNVYRVGGDSYWVVARHGSIPVSPTDEHIPVRRDLVSGRAIIERSVVHVPDLLAESDADFAGARAFATRLGYRAMLAVPMLREGVAIGAIALRSTEVRPFTDKQIELLKTFADQAVIAIENTRLFNELQERLEQQTATSEILRVISQSQRDVQPVFEAIAENARELSRATFACVFRFDGELLRLAAANSVNPDQLEAIRQSFPMPPGRGSAAAQAILTRGVVYITDVREDPNYPLQAHAQTIGSRSVVSVPMLRDGIPIGTINVNGAEAAMFTERQIAMLQTFADQAVIAIENTRLFNEVQARTAELSRSVEELKALGEVGSALSSTLDVDTVLTTILTRANQLAGTQAGQIYDYDDATEELRPRATFGYIKEIDDAVRRSPLRKGEGVTGQAVLKRQPIQVTDITVEGAYESRLRDMAIESGFRAVLAVPLVREDQVMGALTIARTQAGEFPPQVIQLMTTFASQSALAMQNARLFHQLQVASKHKSQFLANMSHELRTPLNTQSWATPS